jgi:hypothetical protein
MNPRSQSPESSAQAQMYRGGCRTAAWCVERRSKARLRNRLAHKASGQRRIYRERRERSLGRGDDKPHIHGLLMAAHRIGNGRRLVPSHSNARDRRGVHLVGNGLSGGAIPKLRTPLALWSRLPATPTRARQIKSADGQSAYSRACHKFLGGTYTGPTARCVLPSYSH